MTDWRAWLLAGAAALIWIAHFDRWTLESWRTPTDYYADAHESLARLKAASEGDVWPLRPQVIARLGAPFGAHWNAYPAPDKPLMLALGGLVHVVGLYAAANLGLLIAQITSALAFYFTARWLRHRWEWAAAGALLFAYTYHTFHRGLAHFSLVFTWTVPIGLLAVWLVARSSRIGWKSTGAFVCVFAAIALGASNPYNLYFWLQLMGWAVVVQWFGPRRRPNLQIGATTIAVALLVFAAVHAETWLYADTPDGTPLLARNYGGTEVYALKPVEMFIPPPFHQWDWLAFFGHRYARWSPWRGEVFLPYLGLAGIVGFVWLLVLTIRRVLAQRPLPGQALSLTWLLAFAAIGGVTNILALFAGIQVFRATNRVAIFVSAIVLFFLVGQLSRLTARWPAWLRFAAALAVGGIGAIEQLPKLESPGELAALAAETRWDHEFGRALEAALPDGAMVFQLPVLSFPEPQPVHRLGDYEHFRPYLVTHDLRFSYGAPKSRARSRWQRELETLPTAELVRRLESYGFAAVYINRRGFDDRAEKLLGELEALGYTSKIEGRGGNQVAVLLHPMPDPLPPLAQTFTYGRGWHLRPEEGWRWAYEDGALSHFNPYPHAIQVDVRFTVAAPTRRQLVLERDDEPLREFQAGPSPAEIVLSAIELEPGVNRFTIHSSEPAIREGMGRNQLRSFGIKDESVRLRAAPTAPDVGTIGAAPAR